MTLDDQAELITDLLLSARMIEGAVDELRTAAPDDQAELIADIVAFMVDALETLHRARMLDDGLLADLRAIADGGES